MDEDVVKALATLLRRCTVDWKSKRVGWDPEIWEPYTVKVMIRGRVSAHGRATMSLVERSEVEAALALLRSE